MHYDSCPVNLELASIDERVARRTAFFSLATVIATLVTRLPEIPIALSIDFLLRSGCAPRFSPLSFLGKQWSKLSTSPRKMVNAAPKRFAARIGTLFSAILSVAAIAGHLPTLFTVGTLFALCIAMEAFFGFCIACKIYTTTQRFRSR